MDVCVLRYVLQAPTSTAGLLSSSSSNPHKQNTYPQLPLARSGHKLQISACLTSQISAEPTTTSSPWGHHHATVSFARRGNKGEQSREQNRCGRGGMGDKGGVVSVHVHLCMYVCVCVCVHRQERSTAYSKKKIILLLRLFNLHPSSTATFMGLTRAKRRFVCVDTMVHMTFFHAHGEAE